MTGFSTEASRATGLNPVPLDSQAPKQMQLTQLGRYRLCFELASGGMATVYLARMEGAHGFEKIVALKRIHPHLVSKRSYVEMFLDEARIASGITHPNVCSVFDFGEANGEYYLAMEYLVGEPLARLTRRAKASPEHRDSPLLPLKMARIIEEACEGLHAAHESTDPNGKPLNVVHRDVSPRNLFMTYSGVIQVVDFGIASANQRLHRTSTGQLKGTMPYMAPEQITGGAVDRRLDVWGLGVVLWEALTLERLFRREIEAETMYAVLVDDIPRPSERRPDIPPELDEIVMKALQRDPEKRWQTSREMGQALHAFAATQSAVVGAAELSDWMQELFPRGEARKREIIELAMTQSVTRPDLTERDATGVRFSSGAPTQTIALPARKRPTAVVFLAGLALLGGGAWGVHTLTAPTDVPVATSPEVEAPSASPLDTAPEVVPPGEEAIPSAAEPAPTESPVVPPAEPDPANPEQAKPEPANPEPANVEAAKPEPTKPNARTRKSNTRKARARAKPRVVSKPEPVAAGLPGQVKIVTKGHSIEIYEAGKYLGKAPTVLTLPAGRHRLQLKSTESGESLTLPVNVVANATKTISLDVN